MEFVGVQFTHTLAELLVTFFQQGRHARHVPLQVFLHLQTCLVDPVVADAGVGVLEQRADLDLRLPVADFGRDLNAEDLRSFELHYIMDREVTELPSLEPGPDVHAVLYVNRRS